MNALIKSFYYNKGNLTEQHFSCINNQVAIVFDDKTNNYNGYKTIDYLEKVSKDQYLQYIGENGGTIPSFIQDYQNSNSTITNSDYRNDGCWDSNSNYRTRSRNNGYRHNCRSNDYYRNNWRHYPSRACNQYGCRGIPSNNNCNQNRVSIGVNTGGFNFGISFKI